MRKVILYIAQSLDGYIAKVDRSIDWLTQFGDAEAVAQDQSYQDLNERIDTVLLGRKTYEQIVNELMIEPNADYFYADKTNYVIISKDLAPRENVIFTSADSVALVENLRMQKGKDIWVIGGARVIRALVEADLIDEYQITIAPILLGDGIRLFEAFKPREQKLRLTKAVERAGLIYLTYVK